MRRYLSLPQSSMVLSNISSGYCSAESNCSACSVCTVKHWFTMLISGTRTIKTFFACWANQYNTLGFPRSFLSYFNLFFSVFGLRIYIFTDRRCRLSLISFKNVIDFRSAMSSSFSSAFRAS